MKKFYIMVMVLFNFSLVDAQFNDDALIIGSYGVGPHNSPQYYFGSSNSSNFSNSIEKDIFHLNTKCVKMLLSTPDSWIDYQGPDRDFMGQTNLGLLTNFNYVGGIIGECDWDLLGQVPPVPSEFVYNFDWPYFFTSGYSKIWRANQRDFNIPVGSIYEYRIIYNEVCRTNGTYIENKTDEEELVDGWILKGPVTDYNSNISDPTAGTWFDTRHRGSRDYWNPSPIDYKIDLKVNLLETPSSSDIEVVKLKTYIHYTQGGTPGIDENEDVLDVQQIKEEKTIISLSLQNYFPNVFAQSDPGPNDKVFVSLAFEVISTGKVWFNIDTIHIYDEKVYKERMRDDAFIGEKVSKYFDTLKIRNVSFFNNSLKYIESIDEPHSINSFWALKKVKETISNYSGTNRPRLLTHFYPSYNGYWQNENIFIRYLSTVNPDPLVFYTYFNRSDNARTSTYWKFRTLQNLIYAQYSLGYSPYRPFIYTVDVWDQSGTNFRAPTALELRSTVLMGLAFGARGILYEPFYSYGAVTGLIDYNTTTQTHSINVLGEYVRDFINPRLNGILGSVINKLQFAGTYECSTAMSIADNYNRPFPALVQGNNYFLKIMERITQPNNSDYLILLTHFNAPVEPDTRYAMLGNHEVDGYSAEIVRLNWYPPTGTNYKNYVLQDVEAVNPSYLCSGVNLPSTVELTCTLGRANSTLYRDGWCVRLGGEIQVNEAVQNSERLKYSELVIKNGAALTINSEYYLEKNLILESGATLNVNGYIFPEGSSRIVSPDWGKSLYRSRSGNRVKLVWSEYPGENIVGYNIYRKKQTDATYYLIASLGNNSSSYIDNDAVIITGPPQGGEILADYKITAKIEDPEIEAIYETGASNVVRYNRIEGYLEKRNSQSATTDYRDHLSQNYPNPFNSETTINYTVKNDGRVTITLYDLLGNAIKTVFDGNVVSGEYSVLLDCSLLPSGTYIYEMRHGEYYEAKKFILIK